MKKRVLIIEDNERNLILEKDLLEVAGLEVFTAVNAQSGISIAQKEKPDVILMDVRLPDMLGTEAAEKLRADDATRDILIIFVTASVMGDEMKLVTAFSNSGYISKPIDTHTFAEDIMRLLRCHEVCKTPVTL
ncbi:MAG: response regulator [Planctomycetota bacterium]